MPDNILLASRFLHQKLRTALPSPKSWWPNVQTQLRSPPRPRTDRTSRTWWTKETTPLSCQSPSLWAPPSSSSTFWLLLLSTTRRTNGGTMSTGAAAPNGTPPMTWLTLRRRRLCPCRWSSTQTWSVTAEATPCTPTTWYWGLPAHQTTL